MSAIMIIVFAVGALTLFIIWRLMSNSALPADNGSNGYPYESGSAIVTTHNSLQLNNGVCDTSDSGGCDSSGDGGSGD
jgi:hypothetical protein